MPGWQGVSVATNSALRIVSLDMSITYSMRSFRLIGYWSVHEEVNYMHVACATCSVILLSPIFPLAFSAEVVL